MIEKLDNRSGERAVRTQILRRFVIKSLPTDVPVEEEEEEDGEFRPNFELDVDGTVGLC